MVFMSFPCRILLVALLVSYSNAFTPTHFPIKTRWKNISHNHIIRSSPRISYASNRQQRRDGHSLTSPTPATNSVSSSSHHEILNSAPSHHIESSPSSSSALAATTSDSSSGSQVHDHVTVDDDIVIALFVILSGLGISGLLKLAGPGSWRYFVAGGICAATSHALVTPIDVVKTRIQVDPAYQDEPFVKATLKMVRKEGIRSLLAGLGPTAFGYLLEGAVKFGVYEVLKPVSRRMLTGIVTLSSILSFIDSKILSFVLSGAVAGAAASLILCPMEALRIRMVAEPEFAPRGWIHGLVRMLQYEGVFGLWKGANPMMLKQVPYTVTKNVSFDLITKNAYALVATGGYAISGGTKVAIPLLSAFLASMLSTISSQPGDMLLSLINAHEGDKRTRDFANDILKSESGVRGFFVGMKARFLHVGIMVTLQLMIYDVIK